MPSDSISSTSLMGSLRQNTRDLHDQTESRVNLPDFLRTREEYRWLLERFYGFYKPLEARLAERTADWETLGLDYAARCKTENLRDDLEVLGATASEISALTQCETVPSPSTIAGTIGCAYVLEGATLGGQIIARHVEQVLGFGSDGGAHFFQSYGTATGAMWQQFRRAVDCYFAHASDDDKIILEEQAIAAARATFLSLDAWLSQDGNP